jgi:hypothetical protein
MDDVVIYQRKLKTLLIAAVSLLFVAIGFYLADGLDAMRLPLWVIVVTSYVGIPFFGLCFVYALYRLLSPKAAVVISREGIFDNASAVGAGMLKWEEIAEIYTYDFMRQRMLGIVPKDAEAVIARQPLFKRILARLNRGLVQAPFNIPQNTLSIPVDELLKKIEERWVITSFSKLKDTTESRYTVGQVWSYKTRPGEEKSSFQVVKVEHHPKLGNIIHVAIRGLQVNNPLSPEGISENIPHLPFSEETIKSSALKLLEEKADLPAYEEGYQMWREEFDAGHAGIFTITISEAVKVMEATLNQ